METWREVVGDEMKYLLMTVKQTVMTMYDNTTRNDVNVDKERLRRY